MNTYDIVTERILQSLEKGIIPWRKPWKSHGLTSNLVSKKPYRGINVMLTACQDYSSPYWVTFNQARALGAHVNKGEKATTVVFWKTGKYNAEGEDGETETRSSFLLRFYHIFNTEQTTLKNAVTEMVEKERVTAKIPTCEEIVDGYVGRPEIKNRKISVGLYDAYYQPATDLVVMPTMPQFKTDEHYYATLFHELVHSTGHAKRLGRDMGKSFGSDKYAKEELIAECGSAFLCGLTGIDKPELNDNTTAYIQGWARALKNDKQLIVKAAAAAQTAVDLITGNAKKENLPEASDELVAA